MGLGADLSGAQQWHEIGLQTEQSFAPRDTSLEMISAP